MLSIWWDKGILFFELLQILAGPNDRFEEALCPRQIAQGIVGEAARIVE